MSCVFIFLKRLSRNWQWKWNSNADTRSRQSHFFRKTHRKWKRKHKTETHVNIGFIDLSFVFLFIFLLSCCLAIEYKKQVQSIGFFHAQFINIANNVKTVANTFFMIAIAKETTAYTLIALILSYLYCFSVVLHSLNDS